MGLFRKREGTKLKLDLAKGKVTLNPGDRLTLTQDAVLDVDLDRRASASVTMTYEWDGFVLKQVRL